QPASAGRAVALSGAAVRLAPHVDLLAYPRDHVAGGVEYLVLEPAQVLGAAGGGGADLGQRLRADVETGPDRAAAWLDEVDRAALVPDVVVAAQLLHQQQHPERVAHREQAAAEVGADVVAVPRAHAQLDPGMAPVRGDVRHMNAGK